MPKTQPHPIGNEVRAEILQLNLVDLFESSHDHTVRTTPPAANEGSPRDIVIVDDGTDVTLYVKTSRGWFFTAALTAL